jgi:hypothetical protein
MLTWEATFGYGDIVGSITNALWRRHIGLDSDLEYIWYTDRPFFPPEKRYHPDDPETVFERLLYIVSQFEDSQNINITHTEKEFLHSDPGKRLKFINRFKQDDWWATLWKTKIAPIETDTIVIWHPLNNVDDLSKDPGTAYKSPLDFKSWEKIIWEVESQYKIEFIDYRMPIHEVFERISKAKMCIGYEGIGQLISKNFWKPCITYTQQPELSKITGGPWIMCDDKYNPLIKNLDAIIEKQNTLILDAKAHYEDRQSRYRS